MTHESKFYTEGGPKITEFRVRFTDLTTLAISIVRIMGVGRGGSCPLLARDIFLF